MHMSSTLLSYWCFFINSSFHHQGRTNVSSVLGVRTPFHCPSKANKTSPPPGRHMPALGFIWRTAIGCRIKGEIYNEVTQLCFVLQIQTMDCISCAMLRAQSSLLKSWGSLGGSASCWTWATACSKMKSRISCNYSPTPASMAKQDFTWAQCSFAF